MQGPISDDQALTLIEDYIHRTLREHMEKEASLQDRSAEAELLLQTLELEYFSILNFKLAGEKVFYFAPSLVERLMETELNVPGSFLKLPFPSCALVYQDPQLIQLFHQSFTETQQPALSLFGESRHHQRVLPAGQADEGAGQNKIGEAQKEAGASPL